MKFIVKGLTSKGQCVWIKRQAGPYRLGPRDHATIFLTLREAHDAISQLPDAIRNGVQLSVEAAD